MPADSKPSGSHVHDSTTSKLTHAPYVTPKDEAFKATYKGRCFCGTIQFSLSGDPKASVYCHCRSCQRLHGAPATLSSIYDKASVSFTAGVESLVFFSPQRKENGYSVPCKLTCAECHAPIGNEGSNMMLMAPTLIDFEEGGGGGGGGTIPDAFLPSFHQYYETRVRDIQDDLPKFRYEKNNTPLNKAAEEYSAKHEREKQESVDDLKEGGPESPKKKSKAK